MKASSSPFEIGVKRVNSCEYNLVKIESFYMNKNFIIKKQISYKVKDKEVFIGIYDLEAKDKEFIKSFENQFQNKSNYIKTDNSGGIIFVGYTKSDDLKSNKRILNCLVSAFAGEE